LTIPFIGDGPWRAYRGHGYFRVEYFGRPQDKSPLSGTGEVYLDEAAAYARRYSRMLRKLKKLEKLHFESIGPGTCSVWSTLPPAAQFAILKDLDYSFRHRPTKS
jgi:hypothetical protein